MADTRETGRTGRSGKTPGFNGPGSTRPGSSRPAGAPRPGTRSTGPGIPRTSTGVRGGGASYVPSLDQHLQKVSADADQKQAEDDAAIASRADGAKAGLAPEAETRDAARGQTPAGRPNSAGESPRNQPGQSGPSGGQSFADGSGSSRPPHRPLMASTDPASPNSPGLPKAAPASGPKSSSRPATTGSSSRNRSGLLAGGGLLGLIGPIAITIAALVPLQLLEIANTMLHDVEKDAEHEIAKGTVNMLKSLLSNDEEGTGSKFSISSGPLHKRAYNMYRNKKIDDLNDDAFKSGAKLTFDKSGNLTGLEYLDEDKNVDLTGASFTERRAAIATFVDEQLGTHSTFVGHIYDVILRTWYTKLMRAHANVSWRTWPKEKIKNAVRNIKDIVWDKIRQGADAQEIEQETGDTPQQAAKEQAAAESSGFGEASGELNAVSEEANKTHDAAKAISDGVKALKEHPAFGVTGLAAMLCILQQEAQTAATNGYVARVDTLIRAGNLVPTMASQMVTGQDISYSYIDLAVGLFIGNSSAPAGSTDQKSWDQSASARRALGQPVDSNPKSADFNPDLSPAANPDGSSLITIIQNFQTIYDSIPDAIVLPCGLLTGVFGTIASIGLQVVEFVVNIRDGEIGEIISSAVDAGIQSALFGWVVPQILAAGTGLSVSTNNSVDMYNNGTAGLSLAENDYMRSIGGRELTDSEEAQIDNQAQNDQTQTVRAGGWRESLFALSNPNSLLSHVIMNSPGNPGQVLADITMVPGSIMSNFATIFMGVRPAEAATPTNINPFGWQFYGFTDAEIDKYDMFDNEDFLTQPVKRSDGTTTTRLAMLGDPSHYDPDNGDDPDTNDLLHCFVNKYSDQHVGIGFEAPGSGDICEGIGLMTSENGSEVFNPTDQQIVNTIYCKDNNVCGLQPNDDFLRYRLQRVYKHLLTGVDCETTDQPCYTGNDPDSD